MRTKIQGSARAASVILLATPTAMAQLPGDECATANFATIGANGPVLTATMTPSADPPENGNCGYLLWNGSRDAWWVFQASSSGLLSLRFCDSDFDTSVVVYQGACGALTRIGCDDDSCNPQGPGYQSSITDLPVSAGPVYIRVGGYGGTTGSARFDLRFKPSVGVVRAWGSNVSGQTDVPMDVGPATFVAAGAEHGLAIRFDGSVAAWGSDLYGQASVPPALGAATAIAAGSEHSMAIAAGGNVVAWGADQFGQSSVPTTVGAVKSIAAGSYHSLAIRLNGTVAAWGRNDYGQGTVPDEVGPARRIAGGGLHSAAIIEGGAVRAWGNDEEGQATVPAGLVATEIAAGAYHTLAIRSNGTVVAWGRPWEGQTAVPPGLGQATAISAGYYHSIALRADGTAVAWGSDDSGQRSVPADLGPAIGIAAGGFHTSAVSVRDCDGNGVVDDFEWPTNDCDSNGINDCWDAAAGRIEDCNADGYGDACEKSLRVVANSGRLGPIGAAQGQTFVIAGAAPALEPDRVTVRVRGRGDFSSGLEYLRVRIGSSFDHRALGGTVDCGAGTPTETFTMDAADFNAAIDPDGSLRVRLDASIAVDRDLCPEGTWVEVEVEYLGALPSDCNLNGVLDSCEVADGLSPDVNHNGIPDDCEAPFVPCAPDFDGNGEVNGADLGVLLGSWGAANPGAPVDLTGDGSVNGADLGILLGAWGPCAS